MGHPLHTPPIFFLQHIMADGMVFNWKDLQEIIQHMGNYLRR
jgi:hypothetical protein